MNNEHVIFKVARYNPGKDDIPTYKTYRIPAPKGISVLAGLRYIYENLDRTLAFRNYACFIGVCTCCLVKVNGKNVRGCTFIAYPGDEVTIEPATGKVIRDLVVAPGNED